jgi:hypothetical protein
MQAITTKYHGPTNTRGARISATSASGIRATIGYPHELDGEAVHRAAVVELCRRLDWHGELVPGETKTGYVYVWLVTAKGYTVIV